MPPGPLTVHSVQSVISDDVRKYLISQNCKTLFMLSTKYGITRGPYFYSRRGIFRTCRLYPDTQETFTLSTIPWDHDPTT